MKPFNLGLSGGNWWIYNTCSIFAAGNVLIQPCGHKRKLNKCDCSRWYELSCDFYILYIWIWKALAWYLRYVERAHSGMIHFKCKYLCYVRLGKCFALFKLIYAMTPSIIAIIISANKRQNCKLTKHNSKKGGCKNYVIICGSYNSSSNS